MSNTSHQGTRLLRLSDVLARVPYTRKHLYELEKAGRFPRRIKLGPNSVAWIESEVEAWISERIQERDNQVS